MSILTGGEDSGHVVEAEIPENLLVLVPVEAAHEVSAKKK